ncbi:MULTISPECIES: TetR/AcrR family transcriptional regulator [unclassified Knoellia]|uniref:TetR/AcrR family transcriptional regulator n=1 Tax=Knoellia altitudinis TaxID=3404795 RepID=UPI00361E4C74
MPPRDRERYHHGDLRRALLEAGLDLTRTGGPAALSLREVTRRVGVTPNAAYRHFADRKSLVQGVAEAIQHRMVARMRAARRASPATSAAEAARVQLRAVGLGYIHFALAEPGWFSVAFFGEPELRLADLSAPASPPAPFLLLVDALDAMEAAGCLTPERRAGAEWPCFAAVHGFAVLALDGPLQHQPRAAVDRWAARTVDDIITGLQQVRS